jgi:GntR family transcriptional repressor for pyruvate dehydrogenase complex
MPQSPAFEQVARQSLSDGVFAQLRDRILRGDLAIGEELPSERLLTELLGVNRGAVREGLKRLQQARLIQVRHGGATQVLDWQREAGLELLPSLLIDAAGRINVAAASGILALRQSLAPPVAASAAQAPERESCCLTLYKIVADMRLASQPADLQDLSFAYWNGLVDGGGNIAFRLAFNSLQHTYQNIRGLLTQVMSAEFRDIDTLDELTAAVRDGDVALAETLARRHVMHGTQAIQALLEAYRNAQGTTQGTAQGNTQGNTQGGLKK